MVRALTEKEREQVINLGALEYSAEHCAAVLGWPLKEIQSAFRDQNSDFFRAYESGRLKAEYVIDLKLFEQAQAGDIKSLDKLELRKRRRK
jgi:hypothetical protein